MDSGVSTKIAGLIQETSSTTHYLDRFREFAAAPHQDKTFTRPVSRS